MKDEADQMREMANESSPQKIKEKMYDIEVEDQALNPFSET